MKFERREKKFLKKEILKIYPNIFNELRDENMFNQTLLHTTCYQSDVDSVKFLLKYNSNIAIQDDMGYTAYHFTMFCKDPIEILNLLMWSTTSRNVINITDNYGRSPLHYAVMFNRVKTVEWLIKKTQIDVDIVDNDGLTADHIDILNGSRINDQIKDLINNCRS